MIEMWELERERGAPVGDRRYASGNRLLDPSTSDLHAWSIFRQNLNSDFTDSALGAEERSPLPYGNFTLKEETVHSIMRNPRLGPRSELASNAFSYLKFGLPRVLPPSGHPPTPAKDKFWRSRDDDDDCSETGERREREGGRVGRGRGGRPAPRARSATDIRHAQAGGNLGVVMNRFKRKGNNGNGRGGMRPAHSEGNILSASTHLQPEQASLNSVWLGSGGQGQGQLTAHPLDSPDQNPNSLPHLQVRGLCVVEGENVLLENISFQLRGGDMMALMTTNAAEGTALLEVLSGKRPSAGGQFFLNGNPLAGQRLGRRVGFLRKETELHPELSPKETLAFYSAFKTTSDKTPRGEKVESILEMLGLSGVGRNQVTSLTPSEKKRLALGCQLIVQTQILLLDSPTEEMDIFDTFFLMNVVDEWTRSGEGGIAICTIHPPTFEVFSTFSKLLLMSGGRTLFYGHRTELLPYFAFIDYPCPPFKNPSDYYIDLVTRDDLSSEALQESTMRIQGLAEAWARRQGVHESGSEGPPHPLSPPIRGPRGAILGEIVLISRFLGLFGCGGMGWRLLSWFLLLLASASISVALGGIYWDVRLGVNAHVNSAYDRMGLNYALIALLPLPVFLLFLAKERGERGPIQSDIQEGLYSQAAAYLAQRIGELAGVLFVLVGYVIPAMAMGGVRDAESLLLTSAYSILCLYTVLAVIRGLDLLFGGCGGLTLGGIILFIFTLSSGYVLHGKDLGEWVDWSRFISPYAWLLPPLAKIEFRNSSFEICSNPIVQLRGNLLMRELSCGLSKGENVLTHFDIPTKPIFLPLLIPIGIILISDLIGFVAVIIKRNK